MNKLAIEGERLIGKLEAAIEISAMFNEYQARLRAEADAFQAIAHRTVASIDAPADLTGDTLIQQPMPDVESMRDAARVGA